MKKWEEWYSWWGLNRENTFSSDNSWQRWADAHCGQGWELLPKKHIQRCVLSSKHSLRFASSLQLCQSSCQASTLACPEVVSLLCWPVYYDYSDFYPRCQHLEIKGKEILLEYMEGSLLQLKIFAICTKFRKK